MQTVPAHRSDKAKSARSFADVGSVVMALEPSYPVFCLRPRVLDAAARRFMSLFIPFNIFLRCFHSYNAFPCPAL